MEIQNVAFILLKLVVYVCCLNIAMSMRLADFSSRIETKDESDERLPATESVHVFKSDGSFHRIRHRRAKVAHRDFVTPGMNLNTNSPQTGPRPQTDGADNLVTPTPLRTQTQSYVFDKSKLNYTSFTQQTSRSSFQQKTTPINSVLATRSAVQSTPVNSYATADNEQRSHTSPQAENLLVKMTAKMATTNVAPDTKSSQTSSYTSTLSQEASSTSQLDKGHTSATDEDKKISAVYYKTTPVVGQNGITQITTNKPEQLIDVSNPLADIHNVTDDDVIMVFQSKSSSTKALITSQLETEPVLTTHSSNNFSLMSTEQFRESLKTNLVSDKTTPRNSQNVATTDRSDLEGHIYSDANVTTISPVFTKNVSSKIQTNADGVSVTLQSEEQQVTPVINSTPQAAAHPQTKRPMDITTSGLIENSNVVTLPDNLSTKGPEIDDLVISNNSSPNEPANDTLNGKTNGVITTDATTVSDQTDIMVLQTNVAGRNDTINQSQALTTAQSEARENATNLVTSVLDIDANISNFTKLANSSDSEYATPVVKLGTNESQTVTTAMETTKVGYFGERENSSDSGRTENVTLSSTNVINQTNDPQLSTTTMPNVALSKTYQTDLTFPNDTSTSKQETAVMGTTVPPFVDNNQTTSVSSTTSSWFNRSNSLPVAQADNLTSVIPDTSDIPTQTDEISDFEQTSPYSRDVTKAISSNYSRSVVFTTVARVTLYTTTASPESVQKFIANWDKLWLFILISCCVLAGTLLVFLLALVVFFATRRKSPGKRSRFSQNPKNHPFIDRDLMYSTEVGNTSETEEVTFGTFGKARGRDRVMISGSSEKIPNPFSAPGVDFIRIKQTPNRFNGKKVEYV